MAPGLDPSNVGRFDDAHMVIEVVEAGSAADTVDHGSLGAQLVALREVYAFKTGDVAAALEAARRAITLDFDDALQARSAACCVYGSALYFSGSIDEAHVTFRQAVQLAEKVGDRRRRIHALGHLALIAADLVSSRMPSAGFAGQQASVHRWRVASTSLMRWCRWRRPPSLMSRRCSCGPTRRLAVGFARKGRESSKLPRR